MSFRITWKSDPTISVTSFLLEVSHDQGNNYTTLATIPYNVKGPNYDTPSKSFFYDDAGGTAGDVYRITASGAAGSSPPYFVIAPPGDPAFCTIIGYIKNAFGEVDKRLSINIESMTMHNDDKWVLSPTGLVASNPQALGITSASRCVYPDDNGMWQVTVVQKAFVTVSIPALNFEWSFIAPEKAGPVNIRDIPSVRGQDITVFGDNDGVAKSYPES